MADNDSVRQRIISSVFSKLNASGYEESYVAHIKIWEEGPDEGGKKPRYILLSQASNGAGSIHKSKLNTNGSFSVGKTWKLVELRGIEVLNPLAFNITLARTYRWQTENQKDQVNFIASLIKLFRTVTGGSMPLQLVGVKDPDAASSSRPAPVSFTRMERAPTPTNGGPLPPVSPRRPIANGYSEAPPRSRRISGASSYSNIPSTPGPRGSSRPRRPQSPYRADSPDLSSRAPSLPEHSSTPTRNRPSTPSQSQQPLPPPSSIRTRAGRAASITNSSMRTSTSTSVSSPVPSIVFPATTPSIRSAVPPVSSDSRTSSSASELRTSLDIPTRSTSPSSSLTQPSPLSAYAVPLETPLTVVPSTSSRRTPSRTPSRAPSMGPVDPGQPRPQQNARVSFFDPANQATLNRLLSGDVVVHDEGEGEGDSVGDGGEESTQATLASVEEMLEGYEWASDDIMGRRAMTGTADQIEARLLDELMALDKANIHSFIESDDRINIVLKYMDAAISELDNMDSVVSSYKIHLNAVSDDIAYIQSQNRGLQVQTQNQRTLLTELEELLQTVQVDRSALLTLTQESLEKASSIQNLEAAATELYKALQAGRDRDMAATMERLDEYKTYNGQFCKRMLDYLSIMFTAQSKLLLGDNNGVVKPAKGRPSIVPHKPIEEYLGRYAGLMLYMKEMDESVYGKICAAYFSAASSLHATQIKALLGMYGLLVKKSPDEELDGFGGVTPTTNAAKAASGIRRAGTIVRSPLEGRRDRKDPGEGDMRASDAFGGVLEQIASTIYREEEFIADFLQINDVALTFADYMGLENYFRRQAARAAGLSQATSKLVRGAMDLIFGFLPIEVKAWLDAVMTKDNLQVVGMIACLERFLTDAEERGNTFLLNLLEKQHVRLKGLFERRVNDHIKSIEDTKLTSKKRKGVAPFIKYFPTYIGRVENQLIGSDTLEIRQIVDTAYDKIVQAMFDALKQMAKMDGEGEDKGQLNYHVIIIENMHYFVAEISVIEIGSVAVFLKRAETIYEENLNAYVKIVLRRPFSKIIEYFEGVERLLKTTAPSEVSSNSSYSRSALKKVVKEYNSKDVRKHIDSLFKRVEKHFTEASEKTTTEDASANTGIAPGTVMVGVWKACEEELLRITELFSKRISQCYKDTGVSLEYTAADVETAFKRHRVNS